jgi:long-subunit acyl-CoA synthetase (AMP-forming)
VCSSDLKHLREGGDRAEIETELGSLMEEVNAGLDPHEQLQFITVVKEVWGIDNGFLTPTMKIRRNIIEKHYEPQLERWYGQRQPVVWESH